MSTNYTYARDGRDEPGDREAPFKFITEDLKIGNKRYESRVSTWERGEDQRTWTKIPSETTYERQHWNVGLAINHHSTTHSSLITSLAKATHWGVYICPIDAQNENNEYHVAQIVLREFHEGHAGSAIYPRDGRAYNLAFNNCQGFAMKVLKKMKDQHWMSPERLQHNFNLADLETFVKSEEDYKWLGQWAW
ncbi:MAG: hypothetical protein Q9191_000768 [Dirinaria sp. TL-2023a]